MTRKTPFIKDISKKIGDNRRVATKRLAQSTYMRRDKSESPLVVFVSGVQRSGTNMLMEFLDNSLETDVFKESDPRIFVNYEISDLDLVKSFAETTNATRLVVKALLEAHAVGEYLNMFPDVRILWMYRHFEDVANSYVRNWPGGRNKLDSLVVDPPSADWRSRGMTPSTLETVKKFYDKDMSDETAIALFWYYRNQLFFDQCLENEERCLIVKYEFFVENPSEMGKRVADFCNLSPSARLWNNIHARSVRRNAPPDISPEVRTLAQGMLDRLDAVFGAQA